MKLKTSLISTAIIVLFASQALRADLTIRAQIDGLSRLVIRSDSIQWDHEQNTRPGRWKDDGAYKLPGYPTTLNGTPWLPRWPDNDEESPGVSDPLDALIQFATNGVSLLSADGRPKVKLLEQPAPTNQFTLVLEFDDTQESGAEFVDVRLSGISVTISPPLLVETERIALSWPTETNQVYQVQYRTRSETNWTDLSSPVRGTGTNASVSDTVIGHERRVYRVRILPR